jgi:hypothetical protein
MVLQEKGLFRKAPANSRSAIYISMAEPVCKWAKLPYAENFVKIFAGFGCCPARPAQPLDSRGPRWFSVRWMGRVRSAGR